MNDTAKLARQPKRKTRSGEVISTKMDKTVIVKTVTRVPHPRFGKIIKQVKKFHVHDENNEAKVGDRVAIMETRPLSRLKRWRLLEIVNSKNLPSKSLEAANNYVAPVLTPSSVNEALSHSEPSTPYSSQPSAASATDSNNTSSQSSSQL